MLFTCICVYLNIYIYIEREREICIGSLAEVQLCLPLCNPMNCSLPGSSVHGIFQVRILEWVALSYSRGSSPTKDGTQVCGTGGQILYH